ncbi:MAG: transcriptional repressor [Erysipelotrichales bacterium]|nr:MAG: transcriptional repressor [Erysipelotrichales bacterium]
MNHYPKNIKKTKARVFVYELLDKTDHPVSSKEIFALLHDQKIWLSTVYRVLERFEQEKIVLRTNGLDGLTNLYELDRHEHKHYAVCLRCHRRFDLEECPLADDVHVHAKGFEVLEHRVEVLGFCAECAREARTNG